MGGFYLLYSFDEVPATDDTPLLLLIVVVFVLALILQFYGV